MSAEAKQAQTLESSAGSWGFSSPMDEGGRPNATSRVAVARVNLFKPQPTTALGAAPLVPIPRHPRGPPSFRTRGAFKALPSSVADWQMPKMKRSLSRGDTWGPKSHPSPPGVSQNRDILGSVGPSRRPLATLEEP
ncbi:hypothetical protein CNYM01_07998 [Colletotrichum nymphaeae SA-01]|uniref:Uncharacterized protein n=1 Tax=Colletotrichum nymphaeae SA-01 TaxID=1460502 RepID=A0A135THE9_9PEZI|nr:hypothetical protein CNYM01_07998 [Colletotrichum nymphaeae SA-01]